MTTGEPCPNCDGYLQVLNTCIVFETRRRYIGCRKCGFRPDDNLETIPLPDAPKQPPRHWQARKSATVATTRIRFRPL